MPARSKTQINLLPKSEFETSFFGRLLKWSLTSGRYIIILTEMVVIVAFLSRFKLDKDLIDLSNTIDGQKAILEASSSIEANFRLTQARINESARILEAQSHPSLVLSGLLNHTPVGVHFETVNISAETQNVTIQGTAVSESSLGSFIRALKTNKAWKGVNLENVSSQENNQINFSLSILM